MDVIVIGGSISGLMHGIMLKSMGHNVHIFEQQDSDRSDYGAGVGTGPLGKAFLQEFDQSQVPLAYDCPGFRFIGRENETVALAPQPMYLTSWTALYYRLRGLFDGLPSAFCTDPAEPPPEHGTAIFDTQKRVISVAPDADDLMVVTYEDRSAVSALTEVCLAHLVIEAGGPYSPVRSSLMKGAQKPQYAGFIAWRGTVSDDRVSQETSRLFDSRFNIFPMGGGNYCIGYAIPGKNGSMEPGQRLLNWIWYTTTSNKDELRTILTDIDGHVHSNSIPRGKLDMAVWEKHRQAILPLGNKAFLELMAATEEPFVSTINESFTSQRSFFDGRLLLVGDGSNLMRPNAGQATNNAAAQCFALRDMLWGKTTLREWEASVVDQGWQMRLFSNMTADRFLLGGWWAKVAAWRLSLFMQWLRFKHVAKRVFKL